MDKAGSSLDDRRAAAGAAFRRFSRQDEAVGGRRALLDGILTDASGLPMLSTHSARPRFYIAVPLGDAVAVVARVPIVGLDKLVERLLRRMRVLPSDWHRDDVRAVLGRVTISDAAVTLELDRLQSLANWRRQGAAFEETSAREILRTMRRALPPSATVKAVGATLVVEMPRTTSRP
jgi:hypothetical protein